MPVPPASTAKIVCRERMRQTASSGLSSEGKECASKDAVLGLKQGHKMKWPKGLKMNGCKGGECDANIAFEYPCNSGRQTTHNDGFGVWVVGMAHRKG